jgi:hypothetical protein
MGWLSVGVFAGLVGVGAGIVWFPRRPIADGLVNVLVAGGSTAGVLADDGGTAGVLADGGGIVGATRALGGSAGDGADIAGCVCARDGSTAGSSSSAERWEGSLNERCRTHRSRHECQP